MVKLMKINEFFKNMKAFSEAVGKFEKEFSCFSSGNSSRIRKDYDDNIGRSNKNSKTTQDNNANNNHKSYNHIKNTNSNIGNQFHLPILPNPSPSLSPLSSQFDHYAEIFYYKNLPELNSIKSSILNII